MRKAFIVLTGILFTLLFATCTQFTADIDDYLSRWSSEAFIQSSSIDKKTYNDGSSIPSVASADKVTITLKVQNPKSFWFVMPSASETRKIVEFAHFVGTKPAAGTDYELIQPSADTLQLVLYSNSFLKNAEWGEKDISSTITLYANDGRPPFKQTFTIPLKVNTPPPKPGYAVAKTTGTTAYYVLCITVPDMDKTAGGGLLHKDLACIEVNGTPYTFSVDEGQHKFTKPEGQVFITHSDVEKLSNQPNDAIPTDSSWVLYYKTDVKVESGAAKKDYTIKLIDKKGLTSDIVNASTKPNKPETEIVRITKGEKIPGSGSGSSDTDPIIIGTDGDKAEIRIASATANTTVHCTRTDTGTSIPYDGNPVTVPLPLNGGNEKQYKLKYYTDGTGFAATPVKTIYYKVVKAHTVTYRVEIVDEVAGGTIETGSSGQKTSGTVSVAHGSSVTFTAKSDTNWNVAGWKKNNDEVNGTNGTYTLSNVTADTAVTVKFYQSTLKNPATWKDLARAVKSAPDNGTITINGEIKATDVAYNESQIDVKKKLTIKKAEGATSAVLDADNKEGIFDVYAKLTLENITLQNSKKPSNYSGGAGVYVNSYGKFIMKGSSVITEFSAENSGGGVYVGGGTFEMHGSSKITRCSANKEGGGVYVQEGGTFKMHDSSAIISCSAKNSGGGVHVKDGTFKMSGSAVVTPATGSEANVKGKNDVYLVTGQAITVDGTLSNNPAARITPELYTEQVVLKAASGSGVTLADEVGKFAVTPPNPPMPWYIDSSGTLKAPDTVTVANGTQLRDAIQNAQVGKPLVITVTQAFSTTESFKIPNGKNITIKDDGTSRTLKCPHIQDKHKFFLVESGGKLTLQGKITLEGESNVNDEQHALYVEQGGTAEIKGNVEIKDFKNNGEACVYTNGTLIMSGGKITGNKARFGGGVFIFDDGIFEMTGGSIEYNSVVSDGSAMRIRGIFNWWGGTIQNNTINNPGPGRGALYIDGGVLNNPHNFTAS